MTAKYPPELRADAREMRRAGRKYADIAAAVGVSASTVSLWVRDVPHPSQDPAAGAAARAEGHRRWAAKRRIELEDARNIQVAAGRGLVGSLSPRELLLIGVMAYWAEGSKSKPWRRQDRVVFTNSDPGLVRVFLSLLRAFDVSPERIRYRVAIHRDADARAATRYWAQVVGAPETAFQRPTLKHSGPRPSRHNRGDGYHGCLVIGVLQSATLYRHLEGMWQALADAAPTLEPPSRVV